MVPAECYSKYQTQVGYLKLHVKSPGPGKFRQFVLPNDNGPGIDEFLYGRSCLVCCLDRGEICSISTAGFHSFEIKEVLDANPHTCKRLCRRFCVIEPGWYSYGE